MESVDNVKCVVCTSLSNGDKMLLCDGCDRGFHTYCINLTNVPENNWYCKKCEKDKDIVKSTFTPGTSVFLYERISTQGQDKPEFGRMGLNTQNNTLLEYASNNNLLINGTVQEIRSAYKPSLYSHQNTKLVKLIKKLKKDDCVLVYSVSRFSRNLKEGKSMLELIHKQGAYIYSVTENISSRDNYFMTLLQIAEYESKSLGLKIKSANKRIKLMGGHIGKPPFGYEIFRDASGIRKLKPNNQEQAIITLIFNTLANKESNASIMPKLLKKLNSLPLEQRCKNWTDGSVCYILRQYKKGKGFYYERNTNKNTLGKFVKDMQNAIETNDDDDMELIDV